MAVRIGSNIASLGAQRRLNQISDSVAGTYERLSSGQRINRASDDAAGLAISMSLRADSRIFGQAIRNVNDGISLLNIAQGATSQLSGIVIRLRELAEQSANGTYTNNQRRSLNEEGEALVAEFNRITQSTTFNGMRLLDSNLRHLSIQAGRGEGSTLEVGVGAGLTRTVGDGTFQAGVSFATGAEPNQVANGDVNGDGKLDLVVANSTGANVSVHLGNGDGTFQAATSFASGGSVVAVALADMNNDGILDVVSSSTVDTSVHIHLGNGNGTFAAGTNINVGYGANNIKIADLNGDGLKDIVCGGNSTNTFTVMNGNGAGGVSSTRIYDTGSSVTSLALADVNGDGIRDVVTGGSTGTIAISLGAGNGTFGLSGTQSISGGYLQNIAGGDLNHDGYDDLAISDSTSNTVRVLISNGTSFTQAMNSGPGGATGVRRIEITDLDGDGFEDLVTSAELGTGAYTFLGRGDGTFGAYGTLSAPGGSGPRAVSCGDFDGDGAIDIIVSLRNSSQLSYFRANGTSTTSLQYLNLTSRETSLEAFSALEAAMSRLAAEVGYLGSAQSRLGVAVNNLGISNENYLAAASRITDADFGAETAELAKSHILQRAAAAILAQANIQPSIALQLLDI